MIIQHNMMAMNGSRTLKVNTNAKAKTTERLSSGYRINRSADDAAGLTISEKMRWQIRGLDKASTNAQDGISMIQTAEGALNEVHSMLHRMNELATQAANDTNTDADRAALQSEIDVLLEEIDRVSDTTVFNTIPVLKIDSLVKVNGASPGGDVVMNNRIKVTPNGGTAHNVYGAALDFSSINPGNLEEMIGKEFTATCTADCNQVFNFKFTDADTSSVNIVGNSMYAEIGVNNPNVNNGEDLVNEIMQLAESKQGEAPFNGYSSAYGDMFIGHANGMASDGAVLQMYSINGGPTYREGMGLVKSSKLVTDSRSIFLQTGAKEGQDIPYVIRNINTGTLGLRGLDVSTHQKAGNTMTAVQKAVNEVSDYRSYLGALQNRLEHTISNVDNTSENTQAAESRIRDTDMAESMVSMSKFNILEQAGVSMLAQANTMTQTVLSLLQ